LKYEALESVTLGGPLKGKCIIVTLGPLKAMDLHQWFPKWAVKQKSAIGGRWNRNGWLGGDRRPSL